MIVTFYYKDNWIDTSYDLISIPRVGERINIRNHDSVVKEIKWIFNNDTTLSHIEIFLD